ncbi:hypothetical protein U1Q18_049764 [Sarracenia purpurea var. burkii]
MDRLRFRNAAVDVHNVQVSLRVILLLNSSGPPPRYNFEVTKMIKGCHLDTTCAHVQFSRNIQLLPSDLAKSRFRFLGGGAGFKGDDHVVHFALHRARI